MKYLLILALLSIALSLKTQEYYNIRKTNTDSDEHPISEPWKASIPCLIKPIFKNKKLYALSKCSNGDCVIFQINTSNGKLEDRFTVGKFCSLYSTPFFFYKGNLVLTRNFNDEQGLFIYDVEKKFELVFQKKLPKVVKFLPFEEHGMIIYTDDKVVYGYHLETDKILYNVTEFFSLDLIGNRDSEHFYVTENFKVFQHNILTGKRNYEIRPVESPFSFTKPIHVLPSGLLFVHQNRNRLMLQYFDKNGKETSLVKLMLIPTFGTSLSIIDSKTNNIYFAFKELLLNSEIPYLMECDEKGKILQKVNLLDLCQVNIDETPIIQAFYDGKILLKFTRTVFVIDVKTMKITNKFISDTSEFYIDATGSYFSCTAYLSECSAIKL